MRLAFWGTACALALCWSGCAAAQDNDVDPVIIVTGEKAVRPLQDTLTSVAVTTGRRSEQENLVSVQEIFQRTANVSDTYYAGGFTIRGIAERGVKGGEGAALATVFVDGAALPSAITLAAPTDMWDVAQVEILRGPQSTLRGLNTLAGAVVITTAAPTMNWTARARAAIADSGETQLAAAAGGPLVPGELAFRVAVDRRDADGFVWNPTRGAQEDPLTSTLLRARLLWTPRALPRLEARLGHTHYDRRSGYPFSYTDTTVPDFFDHRRNFSNDPNDSHARSDITTAELRYAPGGAFSLTSMTAYSDVRETNRYDNDLTAADGGAYHQQNAFRTFSEEVRLNCEGKRLSGLIGVFAYRRSDQVDTLSDNHVPTPVDTIVALLRGNGVDARTAQFIAGRYSQALPYVPVHFAAQASGRVRTYAIFGDARLALTDRFSILAGFRYDHEANNLAINQSAVFAGSYPDPRSFGPVGSPLYFAVAGINQGVNGIVAQANGATVPVDRTFEAFLPKAGIEMAWTADIKTAFTVQRGYRSGGSSSNIARSATFAYNPEYTWNYELALRSAWLGGRLILNANAFYIDWKDQQVSANFGLSIYDTNIVNAGRSHLYGFEIEATHRVNPKFDWYASLGYTRTRFDSFTATIGSVTDYGGLEFAHAPRWTLAGGVNYRPLAHVSINLNASHRSGIFTDVRIPQAATFAAARTLVNARIACALPHWTVAMFASNILNDHYYQYRFDGLPRAVLGNPRVLGVAIETGW